MTGSEDQNNNTLLLAPQHEATSVPEVTQIIRTETVLSKLPVHNLSKTGDFDITIVRKNTAGEVELQWAVSYSARHGPPRQLAYKLDTLVVNRRIDEQGRPVPKVLRLGSLREIARELELGGDTNQIRKALRQNAFTGITARLTYRTAAGESRRIEADFTRYSVVFAGETLPTGVTADAVYLILNEPYLEVLNQAPQRPLNYEYLRQLTPAAQRFYEIASYRIYAAIKYGNAEAKLPYSEFCTCSALQRYADYDHFKKQMYKIHRPHLESAYLERVMYREGTDEEGKPDWLMLYVPGIKARQEFELFHNRRAAIGAAAAARAANRDGTLVSELVARGVHEAQARRLLSGLASGQPVQEQLEWGDLLVARARGRIDNPPGFYVYLLKQNLTPPAALGLKAEQSGSSEEEMSYERYRESEIDRCVADLGETRWRQLVDDHARHLRQQHAVAAYWSEEEMQTVAEAQARAECAAGLAIETFEQYSRARNASTPGSRM